VATLTITNLTDRELPITEMYMRLQPHEVVVEPRTIPGICELFSLFRLLDQGLVTASIAYEPFERIAMGGAGGLPPTTGIDFAALIEHPGHNPIFMALNQDMIQPSWSCGVSISAPSTLEIGDSRVNPSFTASYNRPAAAASLSDGVNPALTLVTPFTAGTMLHTYTSAVPNSSKIFVLTANEAGGAPRTASTGLSWLPKVHFGVAAPGGFDSAFITGLLTNELASSRGRTFAVNSTSGTKIYYAYPTSYGGVPSNFLDATTGFAAGFAKVAANVAVTNAFGVVILYDVWGSDQFALGPVTIRVT
jgi:hypothetical protein